MRREPDIAEFLAHLPLFEGLPPEEIARLAMATDRRKLHRGDVLFREGERVEGFYAVMYGSIALSTGEAKSRGRVTDIIGPRRSFGEAIMFLGKPYIVTATAMTDGLVLHVGKEAIFAALERDPRLARRMLASLSEKLHATVRELDTYARGSGGSRLGAWLLHLVPSGTTDSATVLLPGTKKAIASKLNMSPEHLSRVLRTLTREGLIEVHRRSVVIPSLERLRAWCEQPEAPRT